MKIKCFLLAAALLLAAGTQSVPAQESPVRALSVDEAVRLALDNNLALRRSAVGVETARRAAGRAWNGLSPSLTAAGVVTHSTSVVDPIPFRHDTLMSGFQISAGLTLSTATVENIRRARADYDAGILSHEATRVEIELQVRRLFYQILLLDASRELAARSFESAESRYRQTVTLANVGQAPRIDELSARVDMENLRPALVNAEISFRNALDSLKAILGLPATAVIMPEGDLDGRTALGIGTADISAAIAEAGSPQELSAMLSGIAGSSVEVAILAANIRSLEAQRNAVRNSALVPSLSLTWAAAPMYIQTPPSPMMEPGWNDSGSFTVALGFSLDSFFPWSAARTSIQALDDAIRSTELQVSDTVRNRENRIIQSMRTVMGAVEMMEAVRLNVELAQTSYDTVAAAFRIGAADYQRMRSAGDGLDQARHRLLQERFNLALALLDLERELGVPFGTLMIGE